MLPTRNCEKFTVRGDNGATSTEYRHFIRQDATASTSNNATSIKTHSKNSKQDESKRTTHYVDDKQVYIDNQVNTDRNAASQTSDSGNFYSHRMDPSDTLVSNVYDSKAVQNTIGSSGTVIMDKTGDSKDLIYSNDRNYGKTGWNGHFTYEAPQKQSDRSPSRRESIDTCTAVKNTSRGLSNQSPAEISHREPSPSATTPSTYYVDENYVDTNKARQLQTNTDSRNFYGHRMDTGDTLVSNVYDSKAVQNTIGSSGTVIMDKTGDSEDIIYSNDRNYGKTGWNGHFTYEAPQKQQSPTRQSDRSPSRRGPTDTHRGSSPPAATSSTYYIDTNHVDANEARQRQTNTDSRNFY